jgi:hypothetical protein
MLKIPLARWRIATIVFAILAIAYIGACLFLVGFQTRIIFKPSRNVETTPDRVQLDYQTVWLRVSPGENQSIAAEEQPSEGEYLHGWWIPSAASESPGTLLYLHGNGGNVGANVTHANRFHQLGFSVLLIDYRGYGCSSPPFPNEKRAYADAETAWNYLVRERNIAPPEMTIYGNSLGGAIAIELARRHPEVKGLIVESSFTSSVDMAKYRGYWMFPIELLLHQRFDSIAKVPSLDVPKLFIHGTEDEVVPSYMSENLHEVASEPKQLYIVPGATHDPVANVAEEAFFQTVRQFLESIPKGEKMGR